MKKLYFSFLLLVSIFNWLPAQNKIYVDQSATGTCIGEIGNSYINLQDALLYPGLGLGDTIFVAEGIYFPDEGNCGMNKTNDRNASFYIPNGVVVMGGYNNTFSSRNWTDHPTILSGDIDQDGTLTGNSYHVVRTERVSSATVVDGFTITGGNADGPSLGGGWYNTSAVSNKSNPTILNCVFKGNKAGWGGAMYNAGQGGETSPILTNCVFSENEANNSGGAMYNDARLSRNSSPVLTNCVFSGNKADWGGAVYNDKDFNGTSIPTFVNCEFFDNEAENSGGAMFNEGFNKDVISPMLTNCVFSGNRADWGGAMYNEGDIGISSPTLTNCVFSGNKSIGGGAIYNNGRNNGKSSPVLTNCVFSGNEAEANGGAMYNDGYQGNSTPILTDCEFSGNKSGSGGAMFNNGNVGKSSPILTNCVFSGNKAENSGGALFNEGYQGNSSPLLTNCVFSGNDATWGGAMFNSGYQGKSSPLLTNCVFSGNDATWGGALYNDGRSNGVSSPKIINSIFYKNSSVFINDNASPTVEYSMFDLDFDAVNHNNALANSSSNNKFSMNPRFVYAPASSMAPTTEGDFRLMRGSPAIDMGDNTANMEVEDLDGLSRVYNNTIDMGAYEWRPYCLQDTVYLDENGEVTVLVDGLNLIGELPAFQGCQVDTLLEVSSMATCADSVLIYELFLIRDGMDTVFQCKDTLWVLDTLSPVLDVEAMKAAVNEECSGMMADLSIYVSDNCGMDTVMQRPAAGDILTPGTMVAVELTAKDSSGNETSISFEFKARTQPEINELTFSECELSGGLAIFDLTKVESSVNNSSSFTYQYYENEEATEIIAYPSEYSSMGETVFVVAADGPCADTAAITLTMIQAPKAMYVTLSECETTDGHANFTLTDVETEINGGEGISYTYYGDSTAEMIINSPYTSTDTVVYVVVTDNSTMCTDTAAMTLDVIPAPEANDATLTECETSEGNGIFILEDAKGDINGEEGISYTYFSDSSATMEINSPYTSADKIVYVVISDNSTMCTDTARIILNVIPAPTISCPKDTTIMACMTQATIDDAFATWIEGFTNECEGCDAIDLSVYSAPDSCGGVTAVKYVVTDLCGTPKDSCEATFEVIPPPVEAICPEDIMVSEERSEMEILDAFDQWINSIEVMGGCDVVVENNGTVPNMAEYCLDGVTTVNWTIASACEDTLRCSATFTILASRGGEDSPNCSNFSPAVLDNGNIVFSASDLLTNSDQAKYPVIVTMTNQWGGVVEAFELIDKCMIVTMDICNNLGDRLNFRVMNSAGTCNNGVVDLSGTPPLIMTSAYQFVGHTMLSTRREAIAPHRQDFEGQTGPNISTGKINVYCGQIPDPKEHVPLVEYPCSGITYTPDVQPDWVMPIPCDKTGDTAEVILRTWEVFNKQGDLFTLTDTIVVFRLPKLTPASFVGTAEDSFYCELEPMPNNGESLIRYASWKQPIGLHDYELPFTKLRGVTYEIPATIIIAGLENASA